MRSRLSFIASCTVAAMLLLPSAGCQSLGSAASSQGASSMLNNLIGGEWILNQIGGKDLSSLLPAGLQRPSLSFAKDGRLSGFGGVNRLAGNLDPAALLTGKPDFSKLAMTKMAGTPEANNVENLFTQALASVKSMNIDKSGALNMSDGTSNILKFVRGK